MANYYKSTLWHNISIFCSGAIATFAIPPISIHLFVFALGFGIFLISQSSSLKKIFLSGWFFGFGWFSFGLYWIGSAFLVTDTYHILLMPIAIVLLPSILSCFWVLAGLLTKLVTKKMLNELIKRNKNLPPTEVVRITTMSGCSAINN